MEWHVPNHADVRQSGQSVIILRGCGTVGWYRSPLLSRETAGAVSQSLVLQGARPPTGALLQVGAGVPTPNVLRACRQSLTWDPSLNVQTVLSRLQLNFHG